MAEEGEENEKVRESESVKVAEPLPANKKRIEANKLSPEANTFSRGKVMVNLSHSTLSGTLGSICLVSPPRGLFTRSSQAGLTTVMVYCTVLLSIKLRNFKES